MTLTPFRPSRRARSPASESSAPARRGSSLPPSLLLNCSATRRALQRQRFAVAQQLQLERRTDRRDAFGVVQIVVVVHRLAVDRDDHVAGLELRPRPRANLRAPGSRPRPAARLGAEHARDLRRQVLRLHAERAVLDAAGGDQLAHHVVGQVGRNRKADADVAAGRRVDRRIDADQLAAQIDQGAAGIARIDRGIGLDEVLDSRGRASRCGSAPRRCPRSRSGRGRTDCRARRRNRRRATGSNRPATAR